jgi:hypothetical protein
MNRQIKAENRFIIAMTIVIAVIVIIAMVGYMTGSWEQQP